MIKNLKLTEDFKKKIVAGGLGLVLMTSTGALGVGIHNAKEIKKLTKQTPVPANAITDVDVDKYLTEYKTEKEKLEKDIADLKQQKEELQNDTDKELRLIDLYVIKVKKQDNEEYRVITRDEQISRIDYYIDSIDNYYATQIDKSDFFKLLEKIKPDEDHIYTYSEIHGDFRAVSSQTVKDPLVEDYVRFDEIMPLSLYLTEDEANQMVFKNEAFGTNSIYLSDVDVVLDRINGKEQDYSRRLGR